MRGEGRQIMRPRRGLVLLLPAAAGPCSVLHDSQILCAQARARDFDRDGWRSLGT
jgi:hypothetical protein